MTLWLKLKFLNDKLKIIYTCHYVVIVNVGIVL